jgi:phage terminase large subunit-like protein
MGKQQDKQAAERYREKLRIVREGTVVNPFETKQEQQERIANAKANVEFMVKTYLKHYATAECADFQITLANYVKLNPAQKVLVRWGRGLAKSVWCDLIIPLWLWMRDDIHFAVIVGNNLDKAKMLLSDLQAEFEANPLLKHDFGEQIKSGTWEKGYFRTQNGFIAKALGMGQSPRGLRVFAQRPDYIACDDIEDKDTSKNPKRQAEMVAWIERDLLPTMDGPVRRYLHPNNNPFPSSIQGMLEERHPKWKLFRIDACPGAKRLPRWGAKYPKDYYLKVEGEIGTLALEAEYNNSPHVEGAMFKEEYITWDKMPHINHFNHLLAYWDVAYSDAATADCNAVKFWGVKGDRFYLIKAFVRQCTMAGALRWMFELQKSLPKHISFYYESQFWNDALMMTYKEVRKEFGFDISLIKDERKKDNKYDRILTQLPYYQQGRMIYNINEKANNDMQVGLAQLKGIEPGYKTHDDSPDADEGAIHILSKHISIKAITNEGTFMGYRRANKF